MSEPRDYHVALSFAGEDRAYVEAVAAALLARHIRVFYDRYEEVDLWGKDLYEHLSELYRRRAHYTVMFISAAYAEKLWTRHERRAAQARAFVEAKEYILPVRFDDTELPGDLPTTGYISLKDLAPEALAGLVAQKLARSGIAIEAPPPPEAGRFQPQPSKPATALQVHVWSRDGRPISRAQVVAVGENGVGVAGETDAEGHAELQVPMGRRYTVLVAHPGYPAGRLEDVDPAAAASIVLSPTAGVGSHVIANTGRIPGLKGTLNPILDSSGRTYLYATNIAINGGVGQPATFVVDEPLELEDETGAVTVLTIRFIRRYTVLLEYVQAI